MYSNDGDTSTAATLSRSVQCSDAVDGGVVIRIHPPKEKKLVTNERVADQ